MTTSITTNNRNFGYSNNKALIPEIDNEYYFSLIKYCSDIYVDKDNATKFLPETDFTECNTLEVKIIYRSNIEETKVFILLSQIIDIYNSTNHTDIILDMKSILKMFPENSDIVNQDESYRYLEEWKQNIVYDIINTMEDLSCGSLNKILRDTYTKMKFCYGFNMDEATEDFEKYKQINNPSLNTTGINVIAYKEENRQMFMLALSDIFESNRNSIEMRINNLQRKYDKLNNIFNKE